MKKLIVLTCTLSLLTACGDSIEKKAGEKLAAARAAFERNHCLPEQPSLAHQ